MKMSPVQICEPKATETKNQASKLAVCEQVEETKVKTGRMFVGCHVSGKHVPRTNENFETVMCLYFCSAFQRINCY